MIRIITAVEQIRLIDRQLTELRSSTAINASDRMDLLLDQRRELTHPGEHRDGVAGYVEYGPLG